MSSWNGSVDPMFSNGILRATVKTDESYNATSLIMRTNLAAGSGYLLYGFSQPVSDFAPNDIHFSKFVGGEETIFGRSEAESYQLGEEWVFELGAVGNQISVKFWKVGDPEPAEPQFTVTDDSLSSGSIFVSSDVSHNDDFLPSPANGTFDDIYFTFIPEPSTFILAVLGLIGLVGCARRR